MAFSQGLILLAAKLSALAYRLPDGIADIMRLLPHAHEQPRLILEAVTRRPVGFSVQDDERQIIVFQGTHEYADFIADAKVLLAPLEPHSPAKVHTGFLRRYENLATDIRVHQSKSILFTGHSMGSSIAAIAAALAQAPTVEYIGFGTPRVGNEAFVDAFESRVSQHLRVKNGSDPVNSIIPPFEYRHIGTEMCIGKADPFPDVPRPECLFDHSMPEYIRNLQPAVTQSAGSDTDKDWQDVVPWPSGLVPVSTPTCVRGVREHR
jgi:hypothetical protein